MTNYRFMQALENSAILLTPFVIKIFILSIFLSFRFTQVLLYSSRDSKGLGH